jgi:hypothetical protein
METQLKKVSELEVGKIYTCLLSQFKVIVAEGYTEVRTMSGIARTGNGEKYCSYYNPVTGCYNTFIPVDNQLYEI